MSVTPEDKLAAQEARPMQLSEVSKVIGQQIRKEMDCVRARLYWQNALTNIPTEVVAEALAGALSSKLYQEVPRCQCCCRRG
ncbi:hypothetical protein [Pseudomonas leptonychotis]|uniref:hypothetical protein n=1 Tax=Pseudomonas leptonychotis TaxID=2448482 RepID=UPI003869EB71